MVKAVWREYLTQLVLGYHAKKTGRITAVVRKLGLERRAVTHILLTYPCDGCFK